MAEAKRKRGRPPKDAYDEDGNLKPVETAPPDIPEDEPEVPNQAAAASSELDVLKAQLAELRAQVGELPKKATPDGKWRRNYNVEALRVHGGKEVEHGPDFCPLPPSSIPRYVAVGGGTTDHIDAPVMRYPKTNEFNQPILNDDGTQAYTEVAIGKAAAKDENGEPIKTEEYKYWLHVRQTGRRLNGNVMSDIASGRGLPEGATFPEGQPDFAAAGVVE